MSRRDLILEEMGLGPVWRLRRSGGTPESGAKTETPDAFVQRVGPGTDESAAAAPLIPASQSLDPEDRAGRIARMAWPELKQAVAAHSVVHFVRQPPSSSGVFD